MYHLNTEMPTNEGFINKETGRKVLTVVHNSDLDTLNNGNYENELKGSLREALRYTQKDNFEGGFAVWKLWF